MERAKETKAPLVGASRVEARPWLKLLDYAMAPERSGDELRDREERRLYLEDVVRSTRDPQKVGVITGVPGDEGDEAEEAEEEGEFEDAAEEGEAGDGDGDGEGEGGSDGEEEEGSSDDADGVDGDYDYDPHEPLSEGHARVSWLGDTHPRVEKVEDLTLIDRCFAHGDLVIKVSPLSSRCTRLRTRSCCD